MRFPAVPAERRQTLYLLGEVRHASPVFLDTEVDMTRVREHRDAARADGRRISVVSYVVQAAGRTLLDHPDANAAVRGRLRPRIARYTEVNGKVTFDKKLNDQRVVLSTVLPDVHRAGLAEIQERIDRFRDADADTMPEFARIRTLQRLPVPLGRLVFRAGVRPLGRRAALLGTFSVTSLGHRPVDGFHSAGGTTLTFGLGRITDRAVVRAGQLAVAPVLRLNLAFDHRVIDGAAAADVLGQVREALEGFEEG